VGLYTSPHLHHLGERIQIDGTPLPEADLHALLERYRHAISSAQEAEKGRLSHFEVTTALAFRYEQRIAITYAALTGEMSSHQDGRGFSWCAGILWISRWMWA
jgi:folylpolyglutamate synthase/dihydropteroate synthase